MARRTVLRAVRCGECKRFSLLCPARWAECEAVGAAAAAAGGETEHAANRTPTRRPPDALHTQAPPGRPRSWLGARQDGLDGREQESSGAPPRHTGLCGDGRSTWPAQPVRGQGSARQAALETSSRVTDACTACGSSAIYLIYYALGALPCTVAFLCRCQRAFFSTPPHPPLSLRPPPPPPPLQDLHPTSEHAAAPCLTRSHQRPQPRTSHTCGA